MKVAIVHDWCVVYGGAERVLEHIIDCYPEADVYTLIDCVPEDQRGFLRGKVPYTSFLQKIPFVKHLYRKLLFLMPFAIEQFDLGKYDLVISSSYCVAKGVLTGPNQVHVSYCHSPMRYAWDHYHEYLREGNLERGPLSWLARRQLHKIRTWDVRSSNSVDHFIANSQFVRARIQKFYRRDSNLVFPPVETGLFKLKEEKEDFYVAAGRFVPFKRLDLAVEAFSQMPEKRLIMIGDGPDMAKLRSKAGPNIEFIGFQPPEVVRDYLSRARAFIFPSEEDFGIVPVEAQACGTPVIAFGSGGALETVVGLGIPGGRETPSTGVFFDEQTSESLKTAVERFELARETFSPRAISEHAAAYGPRAFRMNFREQVFLALQGRGYKPAGRHVTGSFPELGEAARQAFAA
jgi:glycosyltransferase involved in cell wall biosynthesis